MKKVILLIILLPYLAYGQIVHNFEPGDDFGWIQSPGERWKADSTGAISGKFSLHHFYDNPEAGYDRTGIPIMELHPSQGLTRWSFLLKHGYDPSLSNNWAIYLLSDIEPSGMSVDDGANGYAIGVNLDGYDDTLRLWKVKEGGIITIVNCDINWQSDIGTIEPVKITVERSLDGIWSVDVSRLNGNHLGTFTGSDKELFTPGWFGISYRYSSTRDRLLWFDDLVIEGVFHEDIDAPEITRCEQAGKNSVEITFNEQPGNADIFPDNFYLNNTENRSISVVKINGLKYRIEFAGTFNNRQKNNLIISSLCDNSGNCRHNIEITFTPCWAIRGDVVISEIMADPLPEVSLPGKEYIEITNRTGYSFDLKNWRLESQDQSMIFPEIIIQPTEVYIVCASKDTSYFLKYGNVIGLKQLPSLTDKGKILFLSDSSGILIHGVEYSSDWYHDELKSNGGWSIEMIDLQYPFYYENNWAASSSRNGGTPGLPNSVSGNNPDSYFAGITNVFPVDSMDINLRFTEPVFNLPENINNIRIGDIKISKIYTIDPLYREFRLIPEDQLFPGQIYRLNIAEHIGDFAGNGIMNASFDFGLPETPVPRDILFNELLFNPWPGDPDFIELYNCSEKTVDVSRLMFVSVNSSTGDTSQVTYISDEKRCLMPGSYYAVTTDPKKIFDRYFSSDPNSIFEAGSLPSMSDNEGHLILFNRELDRIDEVIYDEDMHYSLLSGYEGVSLEKTAPSNRSEERINWHSASESSGWATPGSPNSMFVEPPSSDDKVVLSSSKITPDSDGNDDVLSIKFNLSGYGNVVSVTIYDETGSYVNKVAKNLFTGPEALIIWDGTADDGSPVKNGIYIVFITVYDEKGKTDRWKKVCTVIRN